MGRGQRRLPWACLAGASLSLCYAPKLETATVRCAVLVDALGVQRRLRSTRLGGAAVRRVGPTGTMPSRVRQRAASAAASGPPRSPDRCQQRNAHDGSELDCLLQASGW